LAIKKKKARSGSQTVDRALQILECFTLERPSHSLTELSELTALTVPTTHRLLKALQYREFVVLDVPTRKYTLGSAAMRLAGVVMQRDDIQAVALPHLERLRQVTEETVALHWMVEATRVCVLELVSRHLIRMSSGIGRRYPLYAGAAGKAMLAFLPYEEVEELLDNSARETLGFHLRRSREDLLGELKEIRQAGYATSLGEVVEGASALAAPILDSKGYPVASINITGPSMRWSRERMLKMADTLLSATATIQSQLGYVLPTTENVSGL
jgi:IclR family transcriptional regulator, KDG regulon repressor